MYVVPKPSLCACRRTMAVRTLSVCLRARAHVALRDVWLCVATLLNMVILQQKIASA